MIDGDDEEEEYMESNDNIVHRVENRYATDRRYIWFICDPPHLLKTARNCLLSSCHGGSRHMWKYGFDILWNHISNIYYEDLECGLKLLPKLTRDHVHLNSYSKMNVRLAAQVLSSSVGNVSILDYF